MPGIDLKSLSDRQQQLAENARIAMEGGQLDYVLEVTSELLRAAPGCLEVRRLQRSAQLTRFRRHGGLRRRLRALAGLVVLWIRHPKSATERLEAAERLLALDPTQSGALKVFADEALALEWPATAAFAREEVRKMRPRDRANLMALGEAWIGAGRPEEALAVAEELLRNAPADGPALELLRHASIAQTVAQGRWDATGTFRDKLRA